MHTVPYPVLCGFILLAYFVPSVIAFVRRHRYLGWIHVLNILLAWTIVGWGCLLIWSLAPPRRHWWMAHHHHHRRSFFKSWRSGRRHRRLRTELCRPIAKSTG